MLIIRIVLINLIILKGLTSPVLALTPPFYTASGNLYYYHQDNLSSNTVMTDSNGVVVNTAKYHGYGDERSRTGTKVGERTYTDQIKDDSSNLMYYNARYYNQQLGIFTQPDQVGGIGKYAYASGNPISRNDPSGNADESGGGEHNCDTLGDLNCVTEKVQPPEPPSKPDLNKPCGPGDDVSTCSQPDLDQLLPPITDEQWLDANRLDGSGNQYLFYNGKKEMLIRKYFEEYIFTGLTSKNQQVKIEAFNRAVGLLSHRMVYVNSANLANVDLAKASSAYNGIGEQGVGAAGITRDASIFSIMSLDNSQGSQAALYTLYHEGIHTFYDRSIDYTVPGAGDLFRLVSLASDNAIAKSELAAFSQESQMANRVYQVTHDPFDKNNYDQTVGYAVAFGKLISGQK